MAAINIIITFRGVDGDGITAYDLSKRPETVLDGLGIRESNELGSVPCGKPQEASVLSGSVF